MTPSEIAKAALDRHAFGIVQISGGKDSLATLHACKDYAEKVIALYVNMGNAFPHVVRHIEETCEAWGIKLYTLTSNVLEAVEVEGLPSDVVPVWAEPLGRALVPGDSGKQKLQSGFDCCKRHLWEPMHQFVIDSGATLLIRGAKSTDEHVGCANGTVENGIEVCFPFWDYTDRQVFDYLNEHEVALPFHYKLGVNHSLDCMQCTAWGNTDAEVQRVNFTREYYPEDYAKLREKMTRVRDTVITEINRVYPFVQAATR